MPINPITSNNVIPFNPSNSINNPNDSYVNQSYASHDAMQDSIMYACMHQASIFIAMSMIKEVNELNGYQVLSHKQIAQIKLHYSRQVVTAQSFPKNQNRIVVKEKSNIKTDKVESGKSKTDLSKVEISKVKMTKCKRERAENAYRNLQKGYMSMLVDYKA